MPENTDSSNFFVSTQTQRRIQEVLPRDSLEYPVPIRTLITASTPTLVLTAPDDSDIVVDSLWFSVASAADETPVSLFITLATVTAANVQADDFVGGFEAAYNPTMFAGRQLFMVQPGESLWAQRTDATSTSRVAVNGVATQRQGAYG